MSLLFAAFFFPVVEDSATRLGINTTGDVVQLVEHWTSTMLMQVRFNGAARDFSPRVNFQCRLSYGVRTPPCAIACIYICAQVKDPVVHVKSSVDY